MTIVTEEVQTGLVYAAEKGNLEKVKYWLSKGARINGLKNTSHSPWFDGWSALHAAAFNNDLPMIEFLIANGADVNLWSHLFINEINGKWWSSTPFPDGPTMMHTPLMCARELETIHVLVNAGADLFAKNKYEENGACSIFDCQCNGGRSEELLKYLSALKK